MMVASRCKRAAMPHSLLAVCVGLWAVHGMDGLPGNWEKSAVAGEPTSRSATVSFELDVQPILTKTGCNSGPCHGKQRGQNGFQLSLLGFDSEFDFDSITRDARGRRIFPASPQQSLLIRKAVGEIPHGGGKRFEVGSEHYQTLLAWISQGGPRRIPEEPQLESVQLAEEDFSLAAGSDASLRLTAFYSDSSSRDVTSLASYLSNEATVAQVDEAGRIHAGELPGETAIMVRYMNRIRVANVIVPREHTYSADAFRQLTRNNFIDDLVYRKLEKTGVLPSEIAPDHVFLRRVYTDIIGRLPTAQEAREFLDTQSADKRRYLIDQLLERPEFVDHWSNQWADLLRPNPYRVGIKAVLNYDNWIREQFRQDAPYDQFVRDLVTAKGSTWRNGAVTLFRDRRSPDEMATLVSQLFLGIRLECAKCHHHPFEKWSQDDFYQFAAFFGKVKHKGTGLSPPISGGEETIFVATSGEVVHPTTGAVMEPRPLFGAATVAEAGDPREALVDWMLSNDNDYFAKVQVNRLWAALMGRGLVEPVDDLRSTNPPSNPELLDALAAEFVQSGYDNQHLIKTIASSHVYALSSNPNESNASDRLNYSRHYRHRLRAEVLMDAIADITQTPSDLRGVPKGSRGSQIWTHRVDSLFLDTFGRPDANQDPPCERTSESTVTQALHLMNAQDLDARIRSEQGRAVKLSLSDLSDQELVRELYLVVYSRYPTDAEARYASELLAAGAGQSRRTAVEDLMWALLNTPECIIQN